LPIPQNSDKAEVTTKARPVSKDWRPISIVLREDISHLTKKGPTWSKCRAHMALELVTGKENEKKHCASHIRQVPVNIHCASKCVEQWKSKMHELFKAFSVEVKSIKASIYIIFDYIIFDYILYIYKF
jgi:hypothetical protein